MTDPPALQKLRHGLEALSLPKTPGRAEALYAFATRLFEWSQRMNLTGHRTLDAILDRLVLESAALSAVLPPLPSLADLGSGAGIPGIPLAVLRPECRVTLVESRERRHHFERAVVRELALKNVEPRLGRAEELAPLPHAAVVAQAVGEREQVLEWMLPWAESGGLLLLPGSPPAPSLEHADVVPEAPRSYRAPGGPERVLWIGHKL